MDGIIDNDKLDQLINRIDPSAYELTRETETYKAVDLLSSIYAKTRSPIFARYLQNLGSNKPAELSIIIFKIQLAQVRIVILELFLLPSIKKQSDTISSVV